MHFAGRQAALGLGLVAFLQSAPRLAAAAEQPAPPTTAARPPVVMPPPAAPLPEAANQRHLRYAEREAQSPRAADFRGGDGHRVGWYVGAGLVTVAILVMAALVLF